MAKIGRKDDDTPSIEIVTDGAVAASPTEFTEDDLAALEAEDVEDDDTVELEARHMVQDEEKLVPIRPRKTVLHTRIGSQWYNFVEGREVMVPLSVRDWLYEKKVL